MPSTPLELASQLEKVEIAVKGESNDLNRDVNAVAPPWIVDPPEELRCIRIAHPCTTTTMQETDQQWFRLTGHS
jgi:hypothetical protein